jgi:type II secretory pathway pseudopilin PulG
MHLHRQRGFTLVQLLVVLGIIAVLIGILIPAVRKTRIAARNTACQAQLANIGAALQMYRRENRDWFPPARPLPELKLSAGPLASMPSVGEFLRPYVGGRIDVFRCPADDADDGCFALHGLSYTYN